MVGPAASRRRTVGAGPEAARSASRVSAKPDDAASSAARVSAGPVAARSAHAVSAEPVDLDIDAREP
eukprot:9499218-Pyramimonas_sp.AAC.1